MQSKREKQEGALARRKADVENYQDAVDNTGPGKKYEGGLDWAIDKLAKAKADVETLTAKLDGTHQTKQAKRDAELKAIGNAI